MASLLINAAIAHLNRNNKQPQNVVFQKTQLNESIEEGIVILTEELSDKHKKIISGMPDTDSWVRQDHDAVFGKGVHTQEIPYSREDEERITTHNYQQRIKTGGWNVIPHHEEVIRHLNRHEYHVTDYVGGYARKNEENAREEKIGKILSKTGADKIQTRIMSKPKYKLQKNEDGTFTHARTPNGKKILETPEKPLNLSQVFASDPIRAAKKDVKLVVTRSKEGVAGMSTGKGWQSCMNLDTGCNRHYVPHDVEQGTLTAYLVKKEDTHFDNPVGRVNLKQFKNEEGHRIWRPEGAVYGAMPQGAIHAIKNWSEIQYPHKEDSIYAKHASLYNDDGNSTIITGNPDFSKLHKHTIDHVGDIIDSAQARRDEFYNKHGFLDDNGDIEREVDSHLNGLPKEFTNNLAIHHKLTTENDPTDIYESDKDTHDHINQWAAHRKVDFDQLSDKDLMHHLNTAEEASDRSRMYDGEPLSDATHIHSKLIGEAMKRNNQELKDKVISHLVNNYDHPNNKDWYQNMDDEDYTNIPHLHSHTENSNLLHKLYHVGKEGNMPGMVSDINDISSADAADFAHRIGKYGDDDFLKEFTNKDYHEHLENEDHHIIKGFHRGLNERADGEEMQHKLIGELNIGGGYSKNSGISPIRDASDLKHVMYNDNISHREDGFEHPGNNELYANMAYYTKHPSVHNALKTRNDTQTPEIQEGIRDNIHGLGKH